MELFSVVVLLCVIIWLLVFLIRKQYLFWKNLNAPYIEPEFPYGNLKGIGREEHPKERLQKFYNEYKGKSPFVGVYFFLQPVALLTDLDLVKNVLIKDFNNFHDRGVYYNEKDDPLSAHLASIYGSKWKLLRAKMTPTFTRGKLKFMFPTIVEVGSRLEEKLKDLMQSDKDIEIKDVFARYTTDVIGSCAFGIECNTLNNQNADFRKMGLRIFDKPRHGFAFTLFLGSIRKWAQFIGVKALRNDVSKFFSDVVLDTMRYRNENKISRHDFMDILIDLQKHEVPDEDRITLNEILAQAFIFFAAGFETSSTLLTFCLYELSLNQHIQDNARNHIEEILERHDGKLSYEAMMDMKYLDQILNETLRLYSPVSTLFRVADNDYQVPGTNHLLKSGTTVAIPVFAIHMDPEIYPNPEVFNPENFSEENLKVRTSVAFLPFGEGPRSCIGLRFGMMQARVGLIAALRKFRYELSSKMEHPVKISKNSFITSPEGGMWLKVKQIKS